MSYIAIAYDIFACSDGTSVPPKDYSHHLSNLAAQHRPGSIFASVRPLREISGYIRPRERTSYPLFKQMEDAGSHPLRRAPPI